MVLQYVAEFSGGDVTAEIQQVPEDGMFGRLTGQNNLFKVETERYTDSPIFLRGPGAGPEVTAAGVMADMLKIVRHVT
jgi:aspartokinase/homoserine dehydrogenase 1